MEYGPRDYSLSFVLAVLVHALVFAMLWFNWVPVDKSPIVMRPHIVQAELVVLEAPKPKPAPTKQKREPKPENSSPKNSGKVTQK